ncbi:MAG TPA: class II aldolase/adducin family protein [Candidatus Limnocylindrales bacterium]|nr:class II aldolase/adducin family protein [Candidatus Limnocylindrales bacterium]
MSATEPRTELVRTAQLLRARGLAVGTSGNVSIRRADGRIVVTPANLDYDELTDADLVVVDTTGAVLDGSRRPTSELALHLAVYAARPDVAAIVHTHSPFATAFSVVRRPIPAVHYVLATLVEPGGDAIAIAEYATFGTPELARNAVSALGADHAALLASHGAIAVGGDLATAFARAERIEELAMLAWRAAAIGEPTVLDAAELDRVRAQMTRFPRQTRD